MRVNIERQIVRLELILNSKDQKPDFAICFNVTYLNVLAKIHILEIQCNIINPITNGPQKSGFITVSKFKKKIRKLLAKILCGAEKGASMTRWLLTCDQASFFWRPAGTFPLESPEISREIFCGLNYVTAVITALQIVSSQLAFQFYLRSLEMKIHWYTRRQVRAKFSMVSKNLLCFYNVM